MLRLQPLAQLNDRLTSCVEEGENPRVRIMGITREPFLPNMVPELGKKGSLVMPLIDTALLGSLHSGIIAPFPSKRSCLLPRRASLTESMMTPPIPSNNHAEIVPKFSPKMESPDVEVVTDRSVGLPIPVNPIRVTERCRMRKIENDSVYNPGAGLGPIKSSIPIIRRRSSTHLGLHKDDVLQILERLGSLTPIVAAAVHSDDVNIVVKCHHRSGATPAIEIHVQAVQVEIVDLPRHYLLRSRKALRHPQDEAQKFYFKVFGEWVHVLLLPPVPLLVTRLSSNAIKHTHLMRVRCVPMHRAQRAASRIARCWRQSTTADGWSSVARAVRRGTLRLSPLASSPPRLPQAFMQAIISHAFRGISGEHEHPRAVLMFGLPGSGKNHVLSQRRRPDHAIVDVDQCLAMMPRFWCGMTQRTDGRVVNGEDWVFPMRSEARRIANLIFGEALRRRSNVIWVGTGRTQKAYASMVSCLRASEYTIEVCGVAVDTATARKRMLNRERKFKRPVPRRVLTDAMTCVPKHFAEIALLADHARVFWNGSPPSPKLIWDNHHGVINRGYWDRWNNPSPLIPTPPQSPSVLTRKAPDHPGTKSTR